MNYTFPLAVYGLQDAFSGYILYLKLWTSNSDPKLIGRWYLEHLYQTRVIGENLRLDKGTETGQMATIHACLRQTHGDGQANQDAVDTVQYGPSTSNKVMIRILMQYIWLSLRGCLWLRIIFARGLLCDSLKKQKEQC